VRLKANSESLKTQCAVLQSPESFLDAICTEGHLDRQALQSAGERLRMLLNTLQVADTESFSALSQVTQFAQFLSTYTKGFKVVFQTGSHDGLFNEKLMTLACMDSSLAMKYVFTTFQSVVLTSGTMSPLDMYPRILDFKPIVSLSIDIDLVRNSIQPIIVTMAEDGTELTSEYTQRNNEDVSRNYGSFLVELSETVPDGLIVFMPSYSRMEEWARVWEKDHYLE
jgi:DNA excision repair protein ERCC-2